MSKDELIKENILLKERYEDLESREEGIRKHLSVFLESFKTNRYSHEDEVKVLSWPEIYFELGKKIESSKTFQSVEELLEAHQHIQISVNELQERVYQNENSGVK